MNNQPIGSIQVEAVVHEWKEGRYGTWANAVIVTQAPATEATFSVKRLGIQPVAGKRFHCEIAIVNNRWSVVSVLMDHLPSTLQSVRASVLVGPTKGVREYLLTPLDPDLDLDGAALVLPQSIVESASIAFIRTGTEVLVDAQRNGSRFEATVLHAPHAGQAFPGGRHAGAAQQPVVAFALNTWSASGAKAVPFATHEEGAPVSARIWVKSSALRALGIQAVHRASLPESDTDEQSRALIDSWSAILRGPREDAEALSIDRVLMWIESAGEETRWNFLRLLAPGMFRVPTADGEVIDWVAATVDSIKVHVPRQQAGPAFQASGPGGDPQSEPMTSLTLSSDTADAAKHTEPFMMVTLQFSDERLGRGTSRAFVAESVSRSAGLAPGVPIIVRLVSRGQYWSASHLHRAMPHLSNTLDDDSALAQ
ncbi:hypothetical protein [Burkholderia catarinensis]|uniref:hypothetical protein n=1 Tax=Burkholderia catarinensis TaxID=1108140 RepID=UPI0009204E48|nr:hypothetical protein [Burkholderia catarinensis]KAG8152911.1 hypothetical protein BFF94_013510 [Burkholderia catarinensis]